MLARLQSLLSGPDISLLILENTEMAQEQAEVEMQGAIQPASKWKKSQREPRLVTAKWIENLCHA